jgi:23S rRNA pseudouridine1911/1915/1917 synthase
VSAEIHHFVYEGEQKERLDHFLVNHLPEFSRTRLQSLIKAGKVLVNEGVAKKGGFKLEAGDKVEVEIPPVKKTELVAEDIPLNVIFENDDVLVINKPAGMVVHPAVGHESGTLVNAALAHAPEMEGIGGEHRPGIVHRLDKDTSGVILLAKNDVAMNHLQEQFRERTTKKVYLALVDGKPATPEGRIDAAIGRDNRNRKRMAVVSPNRGRESITEYKSLEEFEHHILLECYPQTGRTHQIRVHLAFIKCPIVGDTIYGRKKISIKLKRHFLHAHQLTISLPGEDSPRTFEAPLPNNLHNILEQMRQRKP